MSKMSKGEVSILLAILIAVVCLVIGLFGGYYLSAGKIATTTTTSAIVTTLPEGTTATTAASTASWKTYTNTKYGYSIKYPNTDWYIYAKDDTKTTPIISFSRNDATDRSHLIEVTSDSVDTVLNRDAEKQGATKDNYQKSTITFKGIPATQITYTTVIQGNPTSDHKNIIFSKDSYTYILEGITKDYQKLGGIDAGNFDQMLSTFKFTQ